MIHSNLIKCPTNFYSKELVATMNHVITATQPNAPTVLYPTLINSQLIHNLTNLNSLIMTHTSVNLDLHVAKN
jgi:hypothetical protein